MPGLGRGGSSWSLAVLISPQSLVGQSGDVNLIDLSVPSASRNKQPGGNTEEALCMSMYFLAVLLVVKTFLTSPVKYG